ncbi:battenin-like [Diadema setosum]|uniref:battenin-like n=1 Tax=Diadema setosum TaxID=31175 RepID=UPI003B3AC11F
MGESDQTDSQIQGSENDGVSDLRSTMIRNLTAFWIFGMCNNYPYVIMLSAAYDILGQAKIQPTLAPVTTPETFPFQNLTNGTHPENPYDCNPTSTALVLLCDIIPSICIKLLSPWFAEFIPYDARILICIFASSCSFLLVALSETISLRLLGIGIASFGAGFGEFTFLSLCAFYNKNVVSTFSSGTGAAGFFGALCYAGLIAAGLSPSTTVLVMLVVPCILALSYFLLLVKVPTVHRCDWGRRLTHYSALTSSSEAEDESLQHLKVREKLAVIKSSLYLIIPLMIVYIAEYVINQGLFELLFFPGAWLSHEAQYRWYQVVYQLGVFISRSSVNILFIEKTWIMAVLQVVNLIFIVMQLLYFFIPSIFIIFAIILYEGLLGGSAYVCTFYILRTRVSTTNRKEFALGAASVSDSLGIATAAIISFPVHKAFCSRSVK